MKHIEDLVYYDGPFLSLFRNDQNEPYLVSWVNTLGEADDERKHLWLAIKCTEEKLQDYLGGKINLLDMERISPEMYFFTGEIEQHQDVAPVTFDELGEDILPSDESFYDREFWMGVDND